jgi:hypothetical protein
MASVKTALASRPQALLPLFLAHPDGLLLPIPTPLHIHKGQLCAGRAAGRHCREHGLDKVGLQHAQVVVEGGAAGLDQHQAVGALVIGEDFALHLLLQGKIRVRPAP